MKIIKSILPRLFLQILLASAIFLSCAHYKNFFFEQPKKTARARSSTGFDLTQIYEQITTHPETDMFPAVSPDGKWVAFASKRSGNMDIWVKPVAGGSAIQITKHKSDDIMPCWAPDGKNLVFVSYREDAQGDLWIVPIKVRKYGVFPHGAPLRITKYLGADLYPSFSPNGKYIAFSSDRDGTFRLYLIRMRDWQIFQLSPMKATHPSWSPDGKYLCFAAFLPPKNYGQIFIGEIDFSGTNIEIKSVQPVTDGRTNDAFPRWHPQRNEIFFTRYANDTDRDGLLTPDDQPELWKVQLNWRSILTSNFRQNQTSPPGSALSDFHVRQREPQQILSFQEIKLIPALEYDFYAVGSPDSMIYFVSRRGGAEDIFSVSEDGAIPRFDDAFVQFQFAKSYFPLPETDLLFGRSNSLSPTELAYRLLAFQRVFDFFPEQHARFGETYYELARTYAFMGDTLVARSYLEEIIKLFPQNRELVGRASLRLFELDRAKKIDSFQAQVEKLEKIKKQAAGISPVEAEAQLYLAELYFLKKKYTTAIQKLEKLISSYPHEIARCAQAQLLIGDVFSLFGQKEEVISVYLKVPQFYPSETNFVNQALDKILALAEEDDPYQTISSLRLLIQNYSDYPRLGARARYRIAEIFYQQKDYAAAVQELRALQSDFSELPAETARALLFLGKILLIRDDDIGAIRAYKEVAAKYISVENGKFGIEAEERLFNLYLETGSNFQRYGEVNAAYNRFRQAVALMPTHLDANRGMVASLYQLGRIDDAIRFYENRLEKYPFQEKYLYLLGLCYSYQATEKRDRTGQALDLNPELMEKSVQLIEKALSKDYRMIQAYLTLSFNYETLEKYGAAKASLQKSFFERAFDAAIAPVKSIFQTITFQKEKGQKRYYEKAIDALTTAIALNDENANPKLESELALNLASNFYNLKEFGFEKAYHYYQIKLKYDSTFVNERVEAEVFRKMGHCALVVEDFEKGPYFLKRAIKLLIDLGDQKAANISTKRLALLYQLAGDYDLSIEYFKQAAKFDRKHRRYNQLETDYRSIAYNFLLLNDEEEAVRYAKLAIGLIQSGKVKRINAEPNWIKIGILGWEIPVYNLGQISAGQSTAAGGFTTDEEIALIYSILGNAALGQRNVDHAISYLKQKLKIYQQKKDKVAEAIFLNNIGYLYYLKADYSESWDQFYHSYQICRKEEILPGQVMNAVNLSALAVVVNKLKLLPDTTNIEVDEKAERRLIRSLEITQAVIPKIEKLTYGFKRDLAQLYILAGNLHFLQSTASQLVNRDSDLENLLSENLRIWEKWAIADSCYRQAENLCSENGLDNLKIYADQNLSAISSRLGEIEPALKKLTDARKLAYQTNGYQKLWEIDFSLAKLAQIYKGKNDLRIKSADFYFTEAIESLDRSILSAKKYRISPIYLDKVRQLFEAAIRFQLDKRKTEAALQLAEKYRGVNFLSLISNHRLRLKKERHKIFLGNARYLSREITALDEKLRRAREVGNASQQDLVMWTKQKKNYEDEYAKLLKDLKSEDPELEALISPDPVSTGEVQRILGGSRVIVDYFFTGKKLNIWVINEDSVAMAQVEIEPAKVKLKIKNYIQNIDSAEAEIYARDLRKILIDPIATALENYRTLIFVPDAFLAELPFNYFIRFSVPLFPAVRNVVVAPDFAGYYYSFLNRKIKGDYFWANEPNYTYLVAELGYNVSEDKKKNQTTAALLEKMSSVDFMAVASQMEENRSDPLMSKILSGKTSNADVFLRDIFEINFKGSVAAFLLKRNFQSEITRLLFERSLIYAGVPSLILGRETETTGKFLEYFYDYLFDYPPADALFRAQRMMAAEKYPPSAYAFFQTVGFEGMTNAQEEEFARQRFMAKVMVGNQYYEEEKWRDALNAYEQALVMAKKQGDQNAIANLYQLIIYSAAKGEMWERAILYQKELVDRAKDSGDGEQLIEQMRYLIYFYTQNKDYDKAISYQKQYLQIAEKYHQKEEAADSYRRLGLVYEQSRDYSAAVENFSKAVQEYRALGDSLKVAECLKNRGRIFLLYLDQYARAINDQEAALHIFQNFGDVANSMELLQNLGMSHERLANYQKALELQQQGYELAKKLKSNQWIGLSLQYLANIYWKMADYQKALQYQKKAMALFKKLENKKFQSVALSTKGLIHMSLGDLEKAIEFETQALSLAEETGSLIDQATIHKNLSMMFRTAKRMDEASFHLREAIKLDEKSGALRGLSYDYRDLGTIQLSQSLYADAYANLHKALSLSQKILDGRNFVQTLYEIGLYHQKMQDMAAAEDTLSLAGGMAEQLFVPEVSWRAYFALAKIYRDQGKTQLAESSFLRAMSTIETMRSKIKIEEYKSGFIDDKLDVYYALIDFYLASNQQKKAFEIAERAKSRNFADLLANKKIDFRGAVKEEDFVKKRRIEEAMSQLQNEMGLLKLSGLQNMPGKKKKLTALTQQLDSLRAAYQQFLLDLKEQNPELASMISVEPKSIEYFQKMLPDSVLLLEYFTTAEKLYLWAISNGRVLAVQQKISERKLYALVDTLRKSIQKQLLVQNLLKNLYRLLLSPVEKSLNENSHLVIIPHGVLHYLPFSALLDEENKYLIEKHTISLSPSAMVWATCMDKGDEFVTNKNWQPNILALGNPDVGDARYDLPFAKKEIESIELIYPHVQAFLGKEAQETKAKELSANANLLLFSCHGEFDPLNPLFSALLLAPDDKNDGRLEAHEIFGLDIHAYLVAMSACETGLSKVGVGDEVVGLSRSFIYAGASSLLSSLWKVDDLATAVTIKRFFRYLHQGYSRARALQQAVLFVKNNINAHPLYWSAFNITGDFR
ncbi:MAG: CHAT domain-containing protein [Calditrichaeota bacterium]|nr:CHAT domain-containing protein [Calditrichota bacterium]